MNELAASILILLAKYGPTVVEEIVLLTQKETITVDEWKSLFAKLKTYEEYVAPKVV